MMDQRSCAHWLGLRIRSICFHTILVALPFGVEYTPADSARTNVQVSLGHGNYASILEGCEDPEPIQKDQLTYSAVGLQVDRQLIPHVRLGVRGSYIYDEEIADRQVRSTQVLIINPFVNLEGRYFALGMGYVYNDHGVGPTSSSFYDRTDREEPFDYSFLVRLGDVNQFYLSTSLYNSVPFYSRGYFQIGLGGAVENKVRWWAGLGVGPYNGGVGIAEIGFDINRHVTLNVSAGFGEVENIRENTFNLGLRFRLPK